MQSPPLGAGGKANGMADHNNSGSVNESRQNGDPGPTRRAVSIELIFLASLFGIRGQPIPRYRQPAPQYLGGLARIYLRYVAKIRLTGEGNPVLHNQNGDTASALPIFQPARRRQ